MNWEAIGVIADIGGALAVLVTLIYLAIQIQHVKRQSLIASYQHNIDRAADFASHIASSESLAEIITRGRASYASLKPDEQLRFEHVYTMFLNGIESWHFQVIQTSDRGRYRDEQLRNMGEAIRHYCDYPGFIQL